MSRANFKKLLYRFYLSIFFVIPFFFWPYSPISFEIPKVWIFQRYVEILAILFIFFTLTIKTTNRVDFKLYRLVFLFLGIQFVSAIIGSDFKRSFWGNIFRGDGLITYIHLICFSLITSNILNKKMIYDATGIISLSSFLLAILYLAQSLAINLWGNFIPNWYGKPLYPFGNPVFASGYFISSIPFIFHYFRKNSIKKALIIFTLILILIILETDGAIITLLFASFVSFLLRIHNKITKIFIIFAGTIAFLAGSIIFINRYINYKTSKLGFLPEGRERILVKAFLAFQEKPIIGWGWANFDRAFNAYKWPYPILHDVYVDKAHSIMVEVLVTTGAIGFITYISLNFYLILRSSTQKFLFLFLLIYLLHSQTNIISISEEYLYWFVVGIIGSKIYTSKKQNKSKLKNNQKLSLLQSALSLKSNIILDKLTNLFKSN